MNTASIIKKVSIVVGALAVIVSFQNCSKIQPSVLMQDVGAGVSGAGDSLISGADDSLNEIENNNMPGESTELDNGELGGVDPGVELEVADLDEPIKDDIKKDDPKDDVKEDPVAEETESDDSNDDLLAECAKAKKSAVSASGDITIEGGSNSIKANSLGKVTGPGHGSGNLYIMTDTAPSVTITSIKGVGGKIVLCNAIVGEISNTNGNFRLHKTSVGAASDHVGKYFVYGTSSIQDISGLKKNQVSYVP